LPANKLHKIVINNLPVLITVLVSICTLSTSSAAKTAKTKVLVSGHDSKKTADFEKTVADEDFPLTDLKLEKKPVSRWVYEFEPLKPGEVLSNPDKYLNYLEKLMSDRDHVDGIKFENDKRFADTLQYFIQQLLASDRKKDALKLEHRLARMQAQHPEFVTK
jgi:hypothetical protein